MRGTIVLVGLAGIALLISVFALAASTLPLTPSKSTEADNGLIPETELYIYENVQVLFRTGDVFKDTKQGEAFIFSAKIDLAEPHKESSIDYQYRKRAESSPDFENILAKERKRRPPAKKRFPEPWIAIFPVIHTDKQTLPRTYAIAGIEGDIYDGLTPTETVQKKIPVIESGVRRALQVAQGRKETRVLLPLIGSGAAGLDSGQAIRAVFRGINGAIEEENSPATIVVVLYPGQELKSSLSIEERERLLAKRDEKLDSMARELFEVVTDIRSGIWVHQERLVWIAQVSLLVLAALLAGLIAVAFRRFPVEVPATALIGNVAKWALLTTGFVSLSGKIPLDMSPRPWPQIAALFVAALVVPLWEWAKLGETKNKAS